MLFVCKSHMFHEVPRKNDLCLFIVFVFKGGGGRMHEAYGIPSPRVYAFKACNGRLAFSWEF